MTERTEALLQKLIEKITTCFQYQIEEYQRAELKRQADFIVAREKRELSKHDD